MAPHDVPATAWSPPGLAVPRDVRVALAFMRGALARPVSTPDLARLCGVISGQGRGSPLYPKLLHQFRNKLSELTVTEHR